jgi:tRNA threonylcarbamoyladenosine biosynthesis protein TsaB
MESWQKEGAGTGMLLLGIDTCGSTGSVALGRQAGGDLEIVGEIALEGRSYSSTLITAISDLLKSAEVGLKDLGAIVAVNGPGSFTGVRVGLSAVKGMAEVSRIPVVVVSRLEVLAANSGVQAAALDAHRGEVFFRIGERGFESNATGPDRARPKEMLAGAAELKAIDPPPTQVAVCDEAAATVLKSAWPSAELLHAVPPTAADALRLAAARVAGREFVDLALLDGNYLRRSDAEIFGEATEAHRR